MDDIEQFVMLAIFLGGTFLGGAIVGGKSVQGDAIERGYAIHCPDDGDFAWVGECRDKENE